MDIFRKTEISVRGNYGILLYPEIRKLSKF